MNFAQFFTTTITASFYTICLTHLINRFGLLENGLDVLSMIISILGGIYYFAIFTKFITEEWDLKNG